MTDPRDSLAYVASANSDDAAITVELLEEHGIGAKAFSNLRELGHDLHAGTGCLILAEDVLFEEEVPALRAALESLPAWFDIPLIIVARDVGSTLAIFAEAFPKSGNVAFLERPLNRHTLVSAARVALQATARQREVGRLVKEREDAVTLRDEFLAMLAHELRNPLASMRNATYLLRKLDLQDPRAVKNTDILDRQVTHLARMVDDLMDVERLERRKMALQVETADLNRIVASAVETSLPMAQERGHKITARYWAAEMPVDVDVVRIEQVVCNLITNAAKFSPEPGEIWIDTSVVDGAAIVSVRDAGAGFDADSGEQLFQPFLQLLQPLARTTGGLGIGLTIVRRLVEMHGGVVEARSEGLGRGAAFTVSLPLRAAARLDDPQTPALPGSRRRRRRVVVVDDNLDIRESMESLLLLWGHEVTMASDGRSGAREIIETRPDIALVDIGLPGMDGYEVARAVRRENLGAIRLIAVSGYGQPSDVALAAEAGFDAHLLKPVDLEALEKLLS